MNTAPNESEFYSTKAIDSRSIFGLIISVLGLVGLLISAKPEWFGQNRSATIGFIQMLAMLVSIALLSFGATVSLGSLWGKTERSIVSDFGVRLVSTGYVIALFAGLSDIFTGTVMGAQDKTPSFGPYEQAGLEFGLAVIIIGLLMMIPYRLLLTENEIQAKKETD